jgi:hypothetical protein
MRSRPRGATCAAAALRLREALSAAASLLSFIAISAD